MLMMKVKNGIRTIGRADRLGSGVRNLYKYSKYYSGNEPSFIEGDVFRITVPLDENYSYDYQIKMQENETKNDDLFKKYGLNKNELAILTLIIENPQITQQEISSLTKISLSTVKRILPSLQKKGVLKREGSKRSGVWIIIK